MPRYLLLLLLFSLSSCMKWDYDFDGDAPRADGPGLFVVCEGNYQYGSATLSFYSPSSRTVENEIFYRANGMKLGDVAQSMSMWGDRAWLVVNNSHVIFAIDPVTLRERGRITGLPSPRYIHFLSERKAYVSQLWDPRILIVDPSTYQITGEIEVGGRSTEQMVSLGNHVYCNCWSYQNRIIKIDADADTVVAELEVGMQPQALALDCHGKLWTLTDGGYEGSPYGHEPPELIRIDPLTMTVERRFVFAPDVPARELRLNVAADTIYWISDDVWRMPVTASALPSDPFLPYAGTHYYALTVSPDDGDVYVADAIDYQQPGCIYRFTSGGRLVDSFYTGVTPGAFCWKK